MQQIGKLLHIFEFKGFPFKLAERRDFNPGKEDENSLRSNSLSGFIPKRPLRYGGSNGKFDPDFMQKIANLQPPYFLLNSPPFLCLNLMF